ncbi:MAG: hypothetical protein E6G67_06595 [Actinobacteria bacterium]|nr:MAG: hypothetical protein E6G67_06595 [Actinomycetota bacterium]
MARLYWARNDGMSGHAWLSDGEIEALAREMLVQAMGTDFPVEKFGRGERMHISTTEIERTLADASPEPIEADQKLWRDWLAFLEGAASNGGLLVR